MSQRTFTTSLPSPGSSPIWHTQKDNMTGKIAPDEANLATLPFIRTKNGNSKSPVHYEWTEQGRDGKEHDFFQTFYPGNGMMLPGPTAGRVIMALQSISPGRIDENLRVKTHFNELAGLCHLAKGGSANYRIREAIKRLQGVTIETNSFWLPDRECYADESTIEIFSSHHFKTLPSKTEIDIRWTPEVIELFRTWSKPINLDHLLSIDHCLARRLFHVSALGIYEKGKFVEDLEVLCYGNLGISQSREGCGQLKQSIKGAIQTLREKKMLDVSIEEDPNMSSGCRVVARPMEKMLETYEEIDDPQYWASHLARREVMNLSGTPVQRCREIVDRNGVDRVRKAIKEFDQRRCGEGRKNKVRHAGWLKTVLEDNIDFEESGKEFSGSPVYQSTAPNIEQSSSGGVPVTAKISRHLQMVSPKVYNQIRPEAERHVRKNYANLSEGGKGFESLLNEKVGTLYLKKHGAGSLPDHIASQVKGN